MHRSSNAAGVSPRAARRSGAADLEAEHRAPSLLGNGDRSLRAVVGSAIRRQDELHDVLAAGHVIVDEHPGVGLDLAGDAGGLNREAERRRAGAADGRDADRDPAAVRRLAHRARRASTGERGEYAECRWSARSHRRCMIRDRAGRPGVRPSPRLRRQPCSAPQFDLACHGPQSGVSGCAILPWAAVTQLRRGT